MNTEVTEETRRLTGFSEDREVLGDLCGLCVKGFFGIGISDGSWSNCDERLTRSSSAATWVPALSQSSWHDPFSAELLPHAINSARDGQVPIRLKLLLV